MTNLLKLKLNHGGWKRGLVFKTKFQHPEIRHTGRQETATDAIIYEMEKKYLLTMTIRNSLVILESKRLIH